VPVSVPVADANCAWAVDEVGLRLPKTSQRVSVEYDRNPFNTRRREWCDFQWAAPGGPAASPMNLKHLVGLVALCVVKESDDLGC
jgi:hypothetical protein